MAVVKAGDIVYVKTSGSNLNMRKSASTSGVLITSVPNGAAVKVANASLISGAGATIGWLQVTYNGQTGYVSADYLVVGDTSNATTTTTTTTTTTDKKKSIEDTVAAMEEDAKAEAADETVAEGEPESNVLTVTSTSSNSNMTKYIVIGGVALAAVIGGILWWKNRN